MKDSDMNQHDCLRFASIKSSVVVFISKSPLLHIKLTAKILHIAIVIEKVRIPLVAK